MRIIVVSDTHMPRMNKKLPDRLLRALTKADVIIHAGDWTKMAVYEELATHAPTYGVSGNNDGEDIIRRFGLSKIIELEGKRIGIVHGHGVGKRSDTESRAINAFKGERLDAIIYGHSHIPVLKHKREMLILNPGSPTDKRRQAQYSFAIMDISGNELTARHVFFADKT